jgi:20S proteasome alpha/beta subunit
MLIACAGDTEYFEKLRYEIEKRYISEFKDIKEAVDIVESSVKYIYDNYPKRDENFSEIIFCTSVQNKTYLFRIDSYHCFALEVKDFYPIGSGGVFGKYILKRVWDTNLTMISASYVLTYVINETTKIDQYSNPPIYIALMFKIGLTNFLKREQIDAITKTLSLADLRTKSYFKNLIIQPQESSEITTEALMEIAKDGKGKI